ncbi:MAG: class I SAM-dependent methyltransferase [Planctomycetota bacterium]
MTLSVEPPVAATRRAPAGDARTRDFYDRQGWRADEDGRLLDEHLFGKPSATHGPIQQRAHERRFAGIRAFLAPSGPVGDLLEVGCGGNPEPNVVAVAERYVGVDFSTVGLDAANERLAHLAQRRQSDTPLVFRTQQADAVDLPFADGQFDAVYSAHMLYHISDPAAQARAIAEMRRVLKPGGRLLLVLANPRPLLWPSRLAKRVLADSPLETLLRKLKGPSPLPYKPMRISWHLATLRHAGLSDVRCTAYRMASTHTVQRLGETSTFGRKAWRTMDHLERTWPRIAARLGNYVEYRATLSAAGV